MLRYDQLVDMRAFTHLLICLVFVLQYVDVNIDVTTFGIIQLSLSQCSTERYDLITTAAPQQINVRNAGDSIADSQTPRITS